MQVEPLQLGTDDLSLMLALTVRRLGQIWRRAEADTPDSALNFAERIWHEFLPSALRDAPAGKSARDLIAGRPESRDLNGRQAALIWAEALGAGRAFTLGQRIESETADIAKKLIPAGFAFSKTGPAAESAKPTIAPSSALFWPLSDWADDTVPKPLDQLPVSSDPSDNYKRLWDRIKPELAQLRADDAHLMAALEAILKLVVGVPISLGGSDRVAGLADHVRAALPIASALLRAVRARLDESPSQWLDVKQPYWLLVGLYVSAEADPATIGSWREQQKNRATLLEEIGVELARAIDRPSLDAARIGRPSVGAELLVVEMGAADRLQKAATAINAKLGSTVALGLSGMPITAEQFVGPESGFGPACVQVMADACRAAAVASAHATAYADWFGPHATPAPATWPTLGHSNAAATNAASTAPVAPTPPPTATTTTAAAAAADAPTEVSGAVTDLAAPPTLANAPEDAKPAPLAATAPPVEFAKPAPAPKSANAVAWIDLVDRAKQTSARHLPFPTPAGITLTEIATAWRWTALVTEKLDAALPMLRDRAFDAGRWVFAAPASLLPDLVCTALEQYRAVWGPQLPYSVAVGLAGAVAPKAGGKKSSPRELLIGPAKTAAALAARTPTPPPGAAELGVVACFPRHSGDGRACMPADDLSQIARMGHQMLSLAGLRLDEQTGHVEFLRRTVDSVVAACRHASRLAFPDRPSVSSGGATRNPQWRPMLLYRLNRLGSRRRPFSRKKPAQPTPADLLVKAVAENRWLGLDRHTSMDAALYLDLAARWVELVMPPPTP